MSLLAFWRRSFSSLAQTIDMAPTSRTFYKRVLPPTGVAFSSPEGQAIFRDAMSQDMLGGFFSVRVGTSTDDVRPLFARPDSLLTRATRVARSSADRAVSDPGRARVLRPGQVRVGGGRWTMDGPTLYGVPDTDPQPLTRRSFVRLFFCSFVPVFAASRWS